MTTKNIAALVSDAVELADNLADTGADEFTQWLGAFLHINKHRTSIPEAEIKAAWEHFQAFKATLPEED